MTDIKRTYIQRRDGTRSVSTTIRLSFEQAEALKAYANERNLSVTTIIRRLIEQLLAKKTTVDSSP